MIVDNKASYHEIDFLLPAQKFNIQFSYVNKAGLPFIREFMLRLIHIAPLARHEIATYFGLSRLETEEAISDLQNRDELTLNPFGKLTLTAKSRSYFGDVGESPVLLEIHNAAVSLTYELASFNCINPSPRKEFHNAAISLNVDHESSSKSEQIVEKYFQRQFSELLDRGVLPKRVEKGSTGKSSVYTVDSVTKLKEAPLRLSVNFQIDREGVAVERDDFEFLKNSENVHAYITAALSGLSKPANIHEIVEAMESISDEETFDIFNKHSVDVKLLEVNQQQEELNSSQRRSILGPPYSRYNFELMKEFMAPVLLRRANETKDYGSSKFLWIAPSDPYWGKSQHFQAFLSNFITEASTSKKKRYIPKLYLPLSGATDRNGAYQWNREIGKEYVDYAYGLQEGFLDGNVEVMYLEDEFVAVIYHISHPDYLPVTLPVGFFSKNKKTVEHIGKIVNEYVGGMSGFDKPHDCGKISDIISQRTRGSNSDQC